MPPFVILIRAGRDFPLNIIIPPSSLENTVIYVKFIHLTFFCDTMTKTLQDKKILLVLTVCVHWWQRLLRGKFVFAGCGKFHSSCLESSYRKSVQFALFVIADTRQSRI